MWAVHCMHVQRLTHVRGRSFPCCGLVGVILRYDILWYIHPSCPQFLPRAWKRSCLRPASVSPLPSFVLKKKILNLPRKCSWLARKKRKNRCMGGAGTERGGSPTTRAFDNPKTDADWQGYVSSSNFLLELLSLHSFSPAHV